MSMPSTAYLCEALTYCADDGSFTWRERPLHHFADQHACDRWNALYPGTPAGYVNNEGYVMLCISGRRYPAHRVAVALVTGSDPGDLLIDHINGDRSDNRYRNLRTASRQQNGQHRFGTQKNNTTGYRGVSLRKLTGRWQAYLTINGQRTHLGYYETPHEAGVVAENARRACFGKFAGTNNTRGTK